MGITEILTEKKKISEQLKNKYNLNKKNKVLGLVIINNTDILEKIINGFSHIPINAVIISEKDLGKKENIVYLDKQEEKNLMGYDFIICDECESDLLKYLKKGIVPIVQKDNYLNNILKEFNPVKVEGNAYFYDKVNEWSIFYAIIRYIENYKFPYDNRNLVKNVLEIY
ncbi:MAG: hypothetical protein PHN31_04465 [Candidatus Gracilibacteria bacterium]|nr:hypothetical protein [Candidatus Gracilibacteria bacterium]